MYTTCSHAAFNVLTYTLLYSIGGQAGSSLQVAQCPSSGAGGYTPCFADFMGFHLTKQASAYLEVCVFSYTFFSILVSSGFVTHRECGSGSPTTILMEMARSRYTVVAGCSQNLKDPFG